MGWFRKSDGPDADSRRLREGLLWMLRAWAPQASSSQRARLALLRTRLTRAPSPVGLLGELRAIAPHARVQAETTAPFGDALRAIARAARSVALLDDGLDSALSAFIDALPAEPDEQDARTLVAEAAALEEAAGPARAQALSERQEVVEHAEKLSALLATLSGVLAADAEAQALVREASEAAAALRERAGRQSRQLASRARGEQDPLTGLRNRGAFDAAFAAQIESSRRRDRSLALVRLDVDDFASVNDTWGGLVGDQVLGAIAERLQRLLRDDDIVARIGGEAFAVVLLGVGTEQAVRVAERIRSDIERQSFSAEGSIFRVTLSIGLDALAAGDDAEALYDRADRALRAARQAGRNCVMVAA